MIRMHLLQLLYRLRDYFVYLEQQESILAKKLPSIVFVFVVIHKMVIVRIDTGDVR